MTVPYHAWTHRPKAEGGTDPIEQAGTDIPWARRSRPYTSADQVIANASFDAFNMVNDYNMSGGDSGAAWFQPETAGSADGIIVQQNAFVLITCGIHWNAVVNATWWLWASIDPTSGTTRRNFPEFAGTSATDQFGAWTWPARCSAGDIVIGGVWQGAGGTRNADASYMEIAVLGTWTGTAVTAMNPDDF